MDHLYVKTLSACLERYPHLASLCPNPYAMLEGSLADLLPYRMHAQELARDHTLDELGRLSKDLHNLSEEQARQRRQRNTRLLSKLAPGRGGGIKAIRMPQGHYTTDPEEIAMVLKDHWAKTFAAKPTCAVTRSRWIEEDRDNRPATHFAGPNDNWKLTVKDFKRALQCSNNSSPGPDGIPFGAWRAIKRLAALT